MGGRIGRIIIIINVERGWCNYGVDLFLVFSASGMAWQRCFVLLGWVSGMPVTDRRTGIGHLETCI